MIFDPVSGRDAPRLPEIAEPSQRRVHLFFPLPLRRSQIPETTQRILFLYLSYASNCQSDRCGDYDLSSRQLLQRHSFLFLALASPCPLTIIDRFC